MIGEREIRVAADLHKSRQLVKSLMGTEAFKETVEAYRPIVAAICEKGNIDILKAIPILVQKLNDGGYFGFPELQAIAACVEIIEPST